MMFFNSNEIEDASTDVCLSVSHYNHMTESRLSAADYDVDRDIAELVTGNSAATERSYACVLRNYCIFNNSDYDSLSGSDFDDGALRHCL